MGRWGGGEMGRWGDGEMGRWGDGEMGRWGDGEMGRWGDGEMGRWGDGGCACLPPRLITDSIKRVYLVLLTADRMLYLTIFTVCVNNCA
ncbi:hypothetical protein [Moorena sp. SIO4A5]|uniref:hypothetical protein n=1 Tax=Moorena sp. SIO4A5 TaxID=2607838 RepID=UPI0013CD87E9|nr:hypothetical protein [Moorena sp. SIO4A5]NEO22533.1 hypothetical protein [Moorena sp. SIO4A5]NEQ60096.1 hypothetical protein [Moorena sp. SIO4A1]